ncbi:MAG: hypothetical protein A2252_04120 [Elusimicrobia bacterium RIFOXYA2_FULL_39_19]|nr:MAG: hypothetical protein A2252_04120 [Elusimicrobia bacterium RIFOXYA2_FULL_39_19]
MAVPNYQQLYRNNIIIGKRNEVSTPFAEIHIYPVSSFYKMILDTCPVKAWIAIKSAPGISA